VSSVPIRLTPNHLSLGRQRHLARPVAPFCCFVAGMAIYHFRLFDLHGRYVRGHFAHCDNEADAQDCANDLLTLTGVTSIEILKDGQLIHEIKKVFGSQGT